MACTLIRLSAVMAAVVAATGCAVLTGEIDDGGRAAREMQNAPVADNDLVGQFGDPSIRVIDQQVNTPLGGRADTPMRPDRVSEPQTAAPSDDEE